MKKPKQFEYETMIKPNLSKPISVSCPSCGAKTLKYERRFSFSTDRELPKALVKNIRVALRRMMRKGASEVDLMMTADEFLDRGILR